MYGFDAQRTGYNLLSDQYIDVPMQWGDMVVVEGDYSLRRDPMMDGFRPVDPFAAPAASGSSGRRRFA